MLLNAFGLLFVDILAGHEGPIACLSFNSNTSLLASGSWDGTLKLWDVYKSSCVETFEHGETLSLTLTLTLTLTITLTLTLTLSVTLNLNLILTINLTLALTLTLTLILILSFTTALTLTPIAVSFNLIVAFFMCIKGCDVLAVAFRPDGKEVACTATNGNIYIWDTDRYTQFQPIPADSSSLQSSHCIFTFFSIGLSSGDQVAVIEGRRDLVGGRRSTDAITAEQAANQKCFTSIDYTADGSCLLAGGRSKYICIYAIASGALVKKFQLSHNRCTHSSTRPQPG